MGRFLILLSALATLSLSAGPARADAATVAPLGGPAPTPPATSPAPRTRRTGLIVGGVVTWGIGYLAGVLLAFNAAGSYNCPEAPTPCDPPGGHEGRDLVIPIVGPWMAIGAEPRDGAPLALLGLMQATGVALATVGIVGRAPDRVPAGEHGGPPAADHRPSGAASLVSFGVLPFGDGAFGFVAGRM